MNKPIFTTHDIAEILSVDMSTVIDWIDRKRIPAYRTPGGHRRVKRGDFYSFLKAYNLPAPAGNRAVLVVEDDPDFRKAVSAMIRARCKDAVIHEAGDGFLAGKKVEALRPDVVVLDLMLPGLDGFKVCEHIRADPALSQVRIVAVSGFDTPENRRRILKAGADVFLPKPMGLDKLGETVERFLGAAGAALQ